MIRKTLQATKAATFSIALPNPTHEGMPLPTGTGFFVSPDGWLVTAAHVVMDSTTDKPRQDIDKAWLMRSAYSETDWDTIYRYATLDHVDDMNDFALIKVDPNLDANQEFLKGRTDFPFIEVSIRSLEEGEPVYSYGYPVAQGELISSSQAGVMKIIEYAPRLTSAVVSSNSETGRWIRSGAETELYVLDKALNFRNSGAPIVSTETGKVHALCSRFYSTRVPQRHLSSDPEKPIFIFVPTLHGIVFRLSNPDVVEALTKRGIPISDK